MSLLNLVILSPKGLEIDLPQVISSAEVNCFRFNELIDLVKFINSNNQALVLMFYPELTSGLKTYIVNTSKNKTGIKFVHVGSENQSLLAWQMRLFHFDIAPFSVGKLRQVLHFYKQVTSPESDFFKYNDLEGLHKIPIQDIQFFKANGNYTECRMTGGKKIIISKQIGLLEDSLFVHSNLVRVNRSWILNFDNISFLNTEKLCFKPDNFEIGMSRDMYKIIKQILHNQGII